MIGEALTCVRSSLDYYLRVQFGLTESAVVLNSLVENDGAVSQKNLNKVVLTLINLGSESGKQYYGGTESSRKNIVNINPAIRFNLYALFTSCFDDYEESLKFLSATLSFFQGTNHLDARNCPQLPAGIEKLQFEVENVDLYQAHNLWSAMGAKYLPSVIYRIRHVTIQAGEIEFTSEKILATHTTVRPD